MYIIKAAVLYSDGQMVIGRTYGQIDALSRKLGFRGERIEGFLTDTDEFVLPDEAAEIALDSGQVDEVNGTLTPDQLWAQGVVRE